MQHDIASGCRAYVALLRWILRSQHGVRSDSPFREVLVQHMPDLRDAVGVWGSRSRV